MLFDQFGRNIEAASKARRYGFTPGTTSPAVPDGDSCYAVGSDTVWPDVYGEECKSEANINEHSRR